MLDIRALRENPETIKDRLRNRGGDVWKLIDEVVACDETRRRCETERQQLQSRRNSLSKEVGKLKSQGQDATAIMDEVKGIATRLEEVGTEADAADARQRELLLSVPNVPHEACPVGFDADANPEVRVWGEKPVLAFAPKDHVTLGTERGWLDFDNAAKISGSGFVVYRGAGARLERALINFLLDLHTREHGYTEVGVPFLVNRASMTGTGQLPKFEEDLYGTENQELFLVPTAEVPVTNLERDNLLKAEGLPIRYAAYTPCFRREAGSAGRDTRGMIRMHQFDKVELVWVTRPEDSMASLEVLTGHAEKVLQLLGLHYRVIELCTGDIGFSACKTYDIEVWAPGQDRFLEVSSCSNFGDYQARRMNLRFKDESGKNTTCHTLNGSGTALARLYVALLETYQQEDGSVRIPGALQPFFGAETLV
ncbi:MAG: serine--tRNA ligase [Verrucomicrobiales bacterium]